MNINVEVKNTANEPGELRRFTMEDLRDRLVEFSRNGKAEKIKPLLSRYCVSRLSDLPKEKYDEMIGEIEAWEKQ